MPTLKLQNKKSKIITSADFVGIDKKTSAGKSVSVVESLPPDKRVLYILDKNVFKVFKLLEKGTIRGTRLTITSSDLDSIEDLASDGPELESLIQRVIDGEDVKDIVNEITTTGAIASYPKPMGIVRTTRTKKRDGYGEKGSFGESVSNHLSEAGYAGGAPSDTFHSRATKAGANQYQGTHGGTPWDAGAGKLYGRNSPRGSGKVADDVQEVSPIGSGSVSTPNYKRVLALSQVDPHRLNPSPNFPVPDKKARKEAIDDFLATEGSIDDLVKKLEKDPKVRNPRGLAHWIGMKKKRKS